MHHFGALHVHKLSYENAPKCNNDSGHQYYNRVSGITVLMICNTSIRTAYWIHYTHFHSSALNTVCIKNLIDDIEIDLTN